MIQHAKTTNWIRLLELSLPSQQCLVRVVLTVPGLANWIFFISGWEVSNCQHSVLFEKAHSHQSKLHDHPFMSDTIQVCLLPKLGFAGKDNWCHCPYNQRKNTQCSSAVCVNCTASVLLSSRKNRIHCWCKVDLLLFIVIIRADSSGANKLASCLDLFFIVPMQTCLFRLLPILSLCSTPAAVSDVQFSWAKQV